MKETQLAVTRQELAVIEASPEAGLSAQAVKRRMECGWSNRTSDSSALSTSQIIRKNSLTFFNMIFIVMAVLMLLVGSSVLNLTFLVVVVVNTCIGCIQEIRAKKAVDKLTLVAAQKIRTLREGQMMLIRSDLLVRDDIVEFRAGDQICADAVLLTGELQVNESLITGEADAIAKAPGDELKSGSFVIAGKARARLTHVGDDAFAAKLAAEAKKNPTAAKSEMMRALDKLIKFIGFTLIPVGILLFINQMHLTDNDFKAGVENTVAALVGMIPEGLYLLTSVAMALSAIKLTKRRVLVQDMNCIESLARVDVLCVDKTGTITEPVMELEQVIPLTNDPPEHLEAILTALYGTSEPENDTARAIAEMFSGENTWVCEKRIPFNSQTKWSGGVFKDQGAFLAGAPEFIMGEAYDTVKELAESWSSAGHRVLLVAKYQGDPQPGALEPALLQPLALLTLTNRIRKEAPDTFAYFARQGVAIKVISGDNPVTVSNVALRAGIENADKYIDANLLETEADIFRAAEEYTVFGRVTPDKKRALIRAMKAQGHTVAMTGDGVNDVLAMKESDCGIAMASGSQAASQVARLVLLDNDFSAMPSIVGEGRRVINNIQRAAALFLVKNIFSLGLALVTVLSGLQFPLEPFHLSIVSALTIGIPGFFLALEPNYERVKGRFLTSTLRRAFPGGLTNILVVLTALGFMSFFEVPLTDVKSISTAILCTVGLSVLLQVCMPFTKLRRFVWIAMAVCVVGAFILLPYLSEYLTLTESSSWLIFLVVLIMVPTVFYAVNRVFSWGDHLVAHFRKKD